MPTSRSNKRAVLRYAYVALLLTCGACASENDERDLASTQRESNSASSALPPTPIVSLSDLQQRIQQTTRITSLLLYQNDRVVLEHFTERTSRNRPINIKSASKSILNALVSIALERGELKSLDTTIDTYLPQYFVRIPAADPRRDITIRHLLTLSSGLPSTSIYNYGNWVSSKDWLAYALNQEPVAPPGTRFLYSTGDTHLLAAVLTRATGVSLRGYAQRHLFGPLGVEIGGWDRDPQGIYFGGNNMALSPEALLRFGRLYLDEGTYGQKRLLPAEWVAESWTPRFLNSSFNGRHDYGYLWWHGEFGGHSAWFAWGYGGQFLFVVPSLRAVVVITGDPDAPSRGGNEVIYDLMDEKIVPFLAQPERAGAAATS